MNNAMEHSVFKDLAPAYIEGLTSEKTNNQMNKHMGQCEECRSYLNEMKEEFFRKDENERTKEKRNIDYFKKVRTNNRKKVLVIVLSLVSVFLLLIATYYIMFVDMRLANADNVEANIQSQDMTTTLTFKPSKKNRYLLTMENSDEGYINSIFVYEMRDDFTPSTKLLKDGISIRYTFVDNNTLLLDDGKKQKIKDEDKVTIHYKDSTDEILVKDLYEIE
ncbi:zf-HC2 domain-containing protein [Sporosarcina sp. FSL W7-1283]|uniref:zf-HC2 domain-containing protein n=1 Tax=Sporosarcina sp. FSL W7-1283 TaxID=2921560 RepID=UPI0030F8108D